MENSTPKTWKELVPTKQDISLSCSIESLHDGYYQNYQYLDYSGSTPSEKAALALLKINLIIEKGYGGAISREEWGTLKEIYTIQYDPSSGKIFTCNSKPMQFFTHLAFRNKELADEFFSYEENLQLIMDYFMIVENEEVGV